MRALRILSTLGAALAVCAFPASRAHADPELVDGIAAQVGTDIVLVSEVMDMVAPVEVELRAAGAPRDEIARLRAEGLERMIEWRLLERVVRQTELYATDEQVDAAIEAIAQDNGLSLEQLKESVTAHGLPFRDYRAQIKREIERSKVMGAMVRSKIHVDEAEVRRMYKERFAEQPDGGEQIHLRQILLTFGGDTGRSRDEACTTVSLARERVLIGEPFEDVARSDNVMAPARGGDMGWLHTSQLADWMVEALKPLQPGQTGEVIELPFGCTLLHVVERTEYTPVSYEAAKPVLERELFAMREAEEYRQWMEKLRETTYIERRGHFAEAGEFIRADGSGSPQRN